MATRSSPTVDLVLIQAAKQGDGGGGRILETTWVQMRPNVRMSAMHASLRQRLPPGTLALPSAVEGTVTPFPHFPGPQFLLL